MTGSIATAPAAADRRAGPLDRQSPVWVGVGFVALAFAVYLLSNPSRRDLYTHFVWQAQAWLDGSAAIPYPVETGPFQNGYLQDVFPLVDRPGYALIPFPPLPALVLLPFVALFGLATQASMVAVALGALNVGLCWRMLLRVTERRAAALLGTTFYGFGTVAWYAAMLGSTWFLAHVVASTFLFLGITAALGGKRAPGRRQLGAGLLFGTAALARLTTIFGAPFFLFVGAGETWPRRALLAGLGAAIPVALLLGYNVATTGQVFHPGYDHIREVEYKPRPHLYHPDWGTEDVRYIPQNARIALLWPPLGPSLAACADVQLSAVDALFDPDCAPLRPDPVGMSILLTSPAYLLAIPVLLRRWRTRLVAGAALSVVAIGLADLAHFSQGWVQFGYRFSNDFAPFAVLLVTLGVAQAGTSRLAWLLAVGLVAASVVVNAWGVAWGVRLGW